MDKLKPAFTRESEQPAEPNEKFKIKDIINKQITQNRTEYLVKWKGYTWKHNSWVNETDLNAAELIREYEQQNQDKEITPNNNNTQTTTTKRKIL